MRRFQGATLGAASQHSPERAVDEKVEGLVVDVVVVDVGVEHVVHDEEEVTAMVGIVVVVAMVVIVIAMVVVIVVGVVVVEAAVGVVAAGVECVELLWWR